MPIFSLAKLATAALLIVSTATNAQQRDDALFKAAEAAQAAVIDTLQKLVVIESGSANLPGLVKVADFAQTQLNALGAKTERIKTSDSERVMVKGVLTGKGKLKVMLIAHMDTVYPDGSLASQPYKRDGNRLYGPGIADDKGGIAVILHSLEILKSLGWNNYAAVTVLFNPDEEIGSNGSGALIQALAAEHDVVLSYEPSPAKSVAKVEGVLLSSAGTAIAKMEVKGRASHAGVAPEEGRNALIELSHQMLATEDIAKNIPGAQLNWTFAQGGEVRNQIPSSAIATADVRLLKSDAAEKLQAALLAKTQESRRVPDTHVHVHIDVRRPPYVAGERGMVLAQKARAIYAELDGRQLFFHPVTSGGTDAGFASGSGKAAVLESLGLAGWGFHAKDEYIEIDSIVPRLYLTSRLLQELGKSL
jgi:glutamate carboxypeptidase